MREHACVRAHIYQYTYIELAKVRKTINQHVQDQNWLGYNPTLHLSVSLRGHPLQSSPPVGRPPRARALSLVFHRPGALCVSPLSLFSPCPFRLSSFQSPSNASPFAQVSLPAAARESHTMLTRGQARLQHMCNSRKRQDRYSNGPIMLRRWPNPHAPSPPRATSRYTKIQPQYPQDVVNRAYPMIKHTH